MKDAIPCMDHTLQLSSNWFCLLFCTKQLNRDHAGKQSQNFMMYFALKTCIVHSNLSFQFCFVKRKHISKPSGKHKPCSSLYTVVNGDSIMNSHYPLISKCKHFCGNNGVLMSWQKWEKMASRIWEWLSGNEDKNHAWRTARRRKGQEKRSQKLQSIALQTKWSSATTCFQKLFSHSAPCNIPQNNLWLTKHKTLLDYIPSLKCTFFSQASFQSFILSCITHWSEHRIWTECQAAPGEV